ncbi:helix-turn-helix transcriptional regulator [Massilia sp. UMI-21]|nr:helix-turn-helix transcriptional regulator [Massilia sp. UMI-21]
MLSGLFLLAIGQGLFLAATLLLLGVRRPEVRAANGLLAALMLLCVAVVAHAWLGIAGLYRAWPHSAMLVLPLGFATGPLLYLYCSRILLEQPLGRRALLHFLPFALATLALLPFYLQPAAAKLAWMRGLDGPPWYVGVAAVLKLVLFLAYLRACHALVGQARAHPLAAGLRRLLGIWLFGGALSMLALALEFAPLGLPLSADVTGALVLLYFLYATAYLAIRQPLGYRPPPIPAPVLAAAPAPRPRYGDRALPDSQRSAFLARLETCMRHEQPWRQGELKLEELAERLALTPHELSQLINGACGANFQDYLNRYRVEALKEALRDPAQCERTILDLALAAGFNSKSALNRVFKAHSGMTPGEFRRQEQALSRA